jgi:glycosyltransferase involved in cell wall biosynthesis
MHAFETYTIYGLFHCFLRRSPVFINNYDGPLPFAIDVPEGMAERGVRRWLREQVLKATDLFVPFSTYSAEQTKLVYPSTASRILALHPGIVPVEWPFREPPLPSERFRLLFVGGDATRKGLGTLLDAFERDLHETCTLTIVTQGGSLPEELRRRIGTLTGVDLYLDLRPGSYELKELYRLSDIFVLPTNYDISSWVALEAMATGVPVIITPSGGIPDIVRDGETGLAIPPQDPQALASAVRRLQASSELRSTLAHQARAHIEKNFDARINTERLLDAARTLVGSRTSRASLVRKGVSQRARPKDAEDSAKN